MWVPSTKQAECASVPLTSLKTTFTKFHNEPHDDLTIRQAACYTPPACMPQEIPLIRNVLGHQTPEGQSQPAQSEKRGRARRRRKVPTEGEQIAANQRANRLFLTIAPKR